MGKVGGKQKIANSGIISGGGANNGKKQSKSALLKLDHLQNLAVWASEDADVPSLGAFFGNRFSACGEAVGAQPDQSLFICERCETIMHPGDNCTVRIEKIKGRKHQKNKGSKAPTQNNVVYRCHFCSHQTVKRGTLRAHMKQICPPKDKPAPKPKVSNAATPVKNTDTELCTYSVSTPATIEHLVMEPYAKISVCASSAVEVGTIEIIDSTCISDTPAPVTPLLETSGSLLDRKKRTRNKPGSKKDPECCSAKTDETSTTRKRRRKTWTSLKDLAKTTQNGNIRNLSDLTIPFFL